METPSFQAKAVLPVKLSGAPSQRQVLGEKEAKSLHRKDAMPQCKHRGKSLHSFLGEESFRAGQ